MALLGLNRPVLETLAALAPERCAVYTPDGAVIVDPHGGYGGGGGFCPPGQAKKGNC